MQTVSYPVPFFFFCVLHVGNAVFGSKGELYGQRTREEMNSYEK
jgi:hypothetical protein